MPDITPYVYIFIVLFAVWFGHALTVHKRACKREHSKLKTIKEKAHKEVLGQIEERKNKILQFIKEEGRITNDGAEALINVSDSTVGRYLDDLEKEGKILQVGKIGRGVYYVAS